MPPLAVLVALADPTRCRIVEILHDGSQPVHILAGHFDISRPAISRHLRVLRQARLISETKVGRENRYALHANRLKPLRDWLEDVTPAAKPAAASPRRPARRSKSLPSDVVTAVPVSQPASVVGPATIAPKPVRDPATSQMGFDF